MKKTQQNSFLPSAIDARTVALSKEFPYAEILLCGKSLCQRPINALVLGCGKKTLLYVGAHHGSEYITAALLMDFAEELCRATNAGERRFGFSVRELLERRRLVILPLVNPDGVALALCGANPESSLGKKQIAMNRDGKDFSHWQANARGVDINHNYDACFCEYKRLEALHGITQGASRFAGSFPESEPETAAVCRLVRTLLPSLAALLTFHTQGEVIFYHDSPLTRHGAAFLSRVSGYTLEKAEGLAAYGGLTDWASTLPVPAYTVEVGCGKNPLPVSQRPLLYATLREMLFTALAFF